MAHTGHSEDSQPTPESDWLADWLARPTRTLRPPVAAPDRWLVYYPICLAGVGVLSLVTGASKRRPLFEAGPSSAEADAP